MQVAYAKKDLKAEVIIDMATLTGAQGVATGRYHGALLSNNEAWERACTLAGRRSGDLVQPIVYCPELNFTDFTSSLADMKNSTSVRWCVFSTTKPIVVPHIIKRTRRSLCVNNFNLFKLTYLYGM